MIEQNATFPNALQAVWLVIAMMMVEYLVGAALYDARGTLAITPDELDGLVMVLANAILFTGLLHYKGLSYRALFHASPASMTSVVVMLFPAIALTVPLIFLTGSALSDLAAAMFPLSASEVAMFSEMSSTSFSMMVATCVLAPVLEEMLFRGIILRSFLQQYDRWPAIAGSAALFGFAHMNLYQYIVAVITGTFLGWLYERTRSLLPCIALHAAYNATCVLAGATSMRDGAGDMPASFWSAALLLGLAGFAMLRRLLVAPAQ